MNQQVAETTIDNPDSTLIWVASIILTLVLLGGYFILGKNRPTLLRNLIFAIGYALGAALVMIGFYEIFFRTDSVLPLWGVFLTILGGVILWYVIHDIRKEAKKP